MSRDCKEGVINSLPSLMLHAAECPMQRKVKKSNTPAARDECQNVGYREYPVSDRDLLDS